MKPAAHLVVMARQPRLGKVKTRLAADIGALAALRFYRHQTGRLLTRLSADKPWQCWLAITPDGAVSASLPWRFDGKIIGQGSGDLGQRMARLFRDLPSGPVVIVGSDIPGITSCHIAQAFDFLGRKDWVLGPASDGGYWLIGAGRRPRFVDPFPGVRWSSSTTMQDTLDNLPGAEISFLEPLDDVDDGSDYRRWREGSL